VDARSNVLSLLTKCLLIEELPFRTCYSRHKSSCANVNVTHAMHCLLVSSALIVIRDISGNLFNRKFGLSREIS